MMGTPTSPVWFSPWRERAICRPNIDWFPPETNTEAVNRLRAICEACPVQTECLDDALAYPKTSDQIGVRAGTTPSERARLRRELLSTTVEN